MRYSKHSMQLEIPQKAKQGSEKNEATKGKAPSRCGIMEVTNSTNTTRRRSAPHEEL
jgi:hypothetical protein